MIETNQKILVIPCAGVEKLSGQLTSHVVLALIEKYKEKLYQISPSIQQIAAKLPNETEKMKEFSIFALNGCGSQCVTKILTGLNFKCEKSYLITQFLKGKNYHPQNLVILTQSELNLVPQMTEELNTDIQNSIIEKSKLKSSLSLTFEPEYESWQEYTYSKFIFKLPFRKNNFLLNGNDVWAYIEGNIVYVGITDYMQKQLSDILIVEFPKIGQQIEQFEGVGSLESSKTVNEIICPVSGKLIATNQNLVESPELINNDPYSKGWIFAIEASNLQEDLENLMKPAEYFKEMIEKIQHTKESEKNVHN